MRTRNRKKSRSTFTLDIHKLYVDGFQHGITQTIELPIRSETDFEVDFCQQILHVAPNHLEVLALLGEAYTRRGDYAKGLETDLRLSQISPEDEVVQYNLACSYALNGKKEMALSALEKAIDLGYRDLDHMRGDRDLELLRSDPRFASMLERLTIGQQEAETA
ncbi:MAG: hypothetical protein KIS92_07700 [Planctomycetota bacterium]|nr:hypothetical protein [Planctomycetota bacterium]